MIKAAVDLTPVSPKDPTCPAVPITVKRTVDIPESETAKSHQNVSLGGVPTGGWATTNGATRTRVSICTKPLGPRHDRAILKFGLGGVKIACENTGNWGSPRHGFEHRFEHVDLYPTIAASWWHVDGVKLNRFPWH